MFSKIAILCIISAQILITIATNTSHHHNQNHHHHHRHGHNHSHDGNYTELRRSGRFICSEKPEDAQRLKNLWDQFDVHCGCSDIDAPACGSDGVTYRNRCHLECTSRNRYQRFSTEKLRLVTLSPCSANPVKPVSRPRTRSDASEHCLLHSGFAIHTTTGSTTTEAS